MGDADLATGNEMVDRLREVANKEGANVVLVSAQVEAELVELSQEDKLEFLQDLGVSMENVDCVHLFVRHMIFSSYKLIIHLDQQNRGLGLSKRVGLPLRPLELSTMTLNVDLSRPRQYPT